MNYSDELWRPEYRCKQCGAPYDLYIWIREGDSLVGREWKCNEHHEDTFFEAIDQEAPKRRRQEFWGEEPVLYDFDSGQEIIY